ncbi:MAG: hypothetical protein JKY84_04000 [Emcibacteraceae bacterium]|nr:hypothetical protein [Emcibacteraceae bacterium]
MELVDKYYKSINNDVDATPYLIPVYKPDREPALYARNLYISADYYVQYDVDEIGNTCNIQILDVINPNANSPMLATNASTFDVYATSAVSRYKFLPPIYYGKNQAVTGIKDVVRFRPIMRY